MEIYELINKFYGKGGNVVARYDIRNIHSNAVEHVNAEELKGAIREKRVRVLGLQLTSDNRLIEVSQSYKLLNKHNNPDNTVTYIIEHIDTGYRKTISEIDLKEAIINRKMKVYGVKLTSDGKLLDKLKRSTTNPSNVIQEYKQLDTNKISYITSKLNSPRAGKAIRRALLIGLTCVSLSGTMTACGDAAYAESVAVSSEVSLQDELKTADKLEFDVITSLNKSSIKIKNADGKEIGKISRDIAVYKISHGIDLYDANGVKVRSGEEKLLRLDPRETWVMQNENGVDKFKVVKNITLLVKKYTIKDMDNNEVGTIEENFDLLHNSNLELKDSSGNTLATVKRDLLRNDFTVEFNSDSETIDREDAITLISHYMLDEEMASRRGSSKSNSSKSNSK